jgi:rare lipoprotein A
MRVRRRLRTALFITAVCATASARVSQGALARKIPSISNSLSNHRQAIVGGRMMRNHLFASRRASLQSGIASSYSGGKTASGERMNSGELTAAHPSLPFGTKIKVTNRNTGRSVVVRINDRGPFVKGRVIDLSPHNPRQLELFADGPHPSLPASDRGRGSPARPTCRPSSTPPARGRTRSSYCL